MNAGSLTAKVELLEVADGAMLAQVRELFREYQQSLAVDLCFQDFEAELARLPGDYRPPQGRLLLARADGEAAACVALRPVEAGTAEMKRLYVRPGYRGAGLGGRLVRRIIGDARDIGYSRLVLDTLPDMRYAQALYETLGFDDVEPYTFNPVPGARFMGLTLAAG